MYKIGKQFSVREKIVFAMCCFIPLERLCAKAKTQPGLNGNPQDVRLRMTILVFHHVMRRPGKESQVYRRSYIDR